MILIKPKPDDSVIAATTQFYPPAPTIQSPRVTISEALPDYRGEDDMTTTQKPALVCTLVAALAAASPLWGADAATSPATAAALTRSDPKAAVIAFTQAMLDGDEKAVFQTLVFASDNERKTAEAVLGQAMAQRRFENALEEVFHEKSEPDVKSVEQIKKMLEKADVTVAGDSAEIAGQGSRYKVVWDNGQWKLDFTETSRMNGDKFDAHVVAAAAAQMSAYKKTIDDIAAKKFKSADEARSELARRLGDEASTEPRNDAKTAATITSIEGLRMALLQFEIDNDRFPTSAEGLNALVACPPDLKRTWHKQLDEVPADGWGRAFIYQGPDKAADGEFEITSAGPDGKMGTADDLTKETRQRK